ncbi:MAG: UDP-N-acetylglucosamine--LPS N-acetylglucosamine transferase [Pseudomonadota bacterium]
MRKKILAIASGGGHWIQLLRLRPAFKDHEVIYVTVQASYSEQVPDCKFYKITDATRWSRWDLLKMIFEVCSIVIKERPDIIISTGAAPGVIALRIGKWLGARTVWLDSIANFEAMSMSGMKAKPCANLWLTQWEHLAHENGPTYKGSVL